MEKEMKKMLLVAVSVGVFLLITITAAILLLTPKNGIEEAAFSSSHPYPAVRTQPVIEYTNDTQPQEIVQDTNTDANRDTTIVSIIGDRNNGDSLTINIPRPSAAAVPDTAAAQPTASNTASSAPAVTTAAATTAAAKPAAAATTARPAATTTTTQTAPAARPAAASSSASASTARQPATARSINNDFWVQTGAFSAMVRSEDAKEQLASKGITSIIENRIVDGRIWYRVRLGPYTSENEANYWLALVQSIDGFTESQIRHTVRQQ